MRHDVLEPRPLPLAFQLTQHLRRKIQRMHHLEPPRQRNRQIARAAANVQRRTHPRKVQSPQQRLVIVAVPHLTPPLRRPPIPVRA